MVELKPILHGGVVPSGLLRKLNPDQIKPNANNPRFLFDEAPLQELRKNIAAHGVLVPITVFQAPGQKKFSILDGERRYRCVVDLTENGHLGSDGKPLQLPANIVEPPDKIAGLLYMFSIHNFREGWELMPTALGLASVMETLEEKDNKALSKLTGLSEPQIERCKKLIELPKRFQELSLDPNPKTRIPSNFWIESAPVLDFAVREIPLLNQLGRNAATDLLIDKYRAKKIKSVIHFRRIMDAYTLTDEDPENRLLLLERVESYFTQVNLETRAVFDGFIVEAKRMGTALSECQSFVAGINKLKLKFIADDGDRKKLREALSEVMALCESLNEMLRGSDDPDVAFGDSDDAGGINK
jgi:hypothetical protein